MNKYEEVIKLRIEGINKESFTGARPEASYRFTWDWGNANRM